MLECERKTPDEVQGIRPHWDQSFVAEDDEEEFRRLSVELLRRFRLRNETTPTNGASRRQQTDDGSGRRYVNVPRCPDSLVVPPARAGSVLLKTDRSPMSPRSRALGAPTAWSSVAQVALARLAESGFYYGSISPTEARRLLRPHPPGTFLVRASSDERFLFSITLRTLGELAS